MKFRHEALTELMEEKSLSMYELAKRSGVAVGTIHNLVHGETKSPRDTVVERLAVALDVDWRFFYEPAFHKSKKRLA